MGISRVVIPAAGLGTRLLPATKAQPKEMLPLLDKPLVQYAVEEAAASGVSDIVVVAGRGRASMEDHFHRTPELEQRLRQQGDLELLQAVEAIAELGRLHFVSQGQPLGLGHALLCARGHVGPEPFAVLLPDEILVGPTPGLRQLLDRHGSRPGLGFSVCRVPRDQVSRYGIIEGTEETPGVWGVSNLVEKPSPGESPSSLAVTGRYVLHPGIFEVLGRTAPGARSEIQLTDAIAAMIDDGPVWAYELEGERYDVGSLDGYLEATVALALGREDLRGSLLSFIEQACIRPI